MLRKLSILSIATGYGSEGSGGVVSGRWLGGGTSRLHPATHSIYLKTRCGFKTLRFYTIFDILDIPHRLNMYTELCWVVLSPNQFTRWLSKQNVLVWTTRRPIFFFVFLFGDNLLIMGIVNITDYNAISTNFRLFII